MLRDGTQKSCLRTHVSCLGGRDLLAPSNMQATDFSKLFKLSKRKQHSSHVIQMHK